MTDAEGVPSSRWWPVLCVHFLLQSAVVGGLALSALGPVPAVPYDLLVVGVAAGLLWMPVAAVAFAFDRRVCVAHSDWTPSRVGFLLTLPTAFNVVVEGLYLYRRHRHLGEP